MADTILTFSTELDDPDPGLLVLAEAAGREAMSSLYEYELTLEVNRAGGLGFDVIDGLLSKPCAVVQSGDAGSRRPIRSASTWFSTRRTTSTSSRVSSSTGASSTASGRSPTARCWLSRTGPIRFPRLCPQPVELSGPLRYRAAGLPQTDAVRDRRVGP